MGLFNNNKNTANKKYDGQLKAQQKDGGNQVNRKTTKYVYLSSRKAVFLVTGEARQNKYNYSLPIIPLHGIYYSAKDKRKYTARELSDYYIILNIEEEDADALEGKKVVVMGYDESETLVIAAEGDDNGSNKA